MYSAIHKILLIIAFILLFVSSSANAIGENLLANPQFHDGFAGWSMVNGYWTIHSPISCESTGTSYVQMDRDRCQTGTCGWPIGGEDWLWQDVYAPDLHTTLVFSLTEVHHMLSGTAEIILYGSYDGQIWEVVYHRPSVESPYGTGKCVRGSPPASFTYEILSIHSYYRLEIHGRMNEEGDGFLFGGFDLHTE